MLSSEYFLRDGLLLAATCALASHGALSRYDQSRALPIIVVVLLGALPSISVLLLRLHFSTLWSAIVVGYSTYYSILGLSVVAYRISPYHPLAQYPGPLLDKITKLRGIWLTAHGKQHVYYTELHAKYGPYVRVGPNELSFLDVNTLAPIMGAEGMPKGPNWDGRRRPTDHPALITLRDMDEHARRRRPWNRAFTTSAVKDYEPIISNRALQLVAELEKRSGVAGGGKNGGTIDLSKWLSFYTFDFMGDMAFGGGFELMRDDDKDGLWHWMENGFTSVVLAAHIPWANHVLFKLPFLSKNNIELRQFAIEKAMTRKKKGSLTKDIFHHLIDEDGVDPEHLRLSMKDVASDGVLAIVAGSDTTSIVMSNLFFYILDNPTEYARLLAEVDAVFPPGEGEPFDAAKLAKMPFLNAVINETLRLQPPVASGSQRAPQRGTGGHSVGTHFIPEGTAIFVPTYAMHRDPRYFSPVPEKFWPDRWLIANETSSDERAVEGEKAASAPNFILNQAAYIPFSYGPANCVGKNLALVEMRMVVCLLLQRFDMRFADRYDPRTWEESLEDWYIMKKGGLPVFLSARS